MKHRKLLSVLLALVMLVGLLPAAALADEVVTTWNGLAAAMNIAEGGEVSIKLTDDLTYAVGDDVLVVPKDATVTLDLNGCELDGYDSGKGVGVEAVITVLGTLILEDKSTDGDGCIGWSDGVGVYVAEGGAFTMSGGDIYYNDIAGVQVAKGGTFTMSGGYVEKNGVGVYVEGGGAFTVSDGGISDNNTAGVYVADGGAFTMSGGMLYDNDAVGLVVVDGAAEMSGGVIADNEIGVLAVGTKKADKPNFTLSGGVIGAAYNEEAWPDPWDDGNNIGVMVGCSFDPTEIPKGKTFEEAFAQYLKDVRTEDMLMTPAAGAVGGSFAMTGGAISANDVMGVMVVGGYDEAANGTVTFRARFDMSGGVITDMPDAKIVEAATKDGQSLPEIIGDSVSPKIGVFVNGGDFAMTGSAKVVGAWTEEYGCLPVSVEVDEDEDEYCTTLELGVYQASGNFTMAEGTEISGHNIMGLGQGYVIDTIMKLLMDLLPEGALRLPAIDPAAKRPGSHVTVNGAIKNNGVVGVFAFGDGEATDSGFTYDTTFTLSPTGVIADGDRMAIAAIEQKSKGEKPVVERITSIGAKVGLIAVGTEVNVAGGITGQEKLSPFVTTTQAKAAAGETPATPEMIDVQVELGAILSDCVFNLAEGGSVSGHNLGGVFAGYHDDLLALILEVAGEDIFALLQKSGESFQKMKYSDFEALVHRFVIQNKTGIVLNLLGAVKNNGIFGIGTVGTLTNKPSIPAVVNVIGGAVEDNKNIGVGGLFTQINVANGGSISGSGLGALAVGASAVNVAEGGAITGNTTGAAAALLSNVNVVGGSVVDNTKAFTVNPVDAEGASKDSLDDLLALVGTLPAGVTNILEQAVLPLIRTYLGGVTDTENEYYKAAKTVEYLINNFLHIEFEVDEENPAKYMDMVRQMTEDFQQVGVVVETMTSAVNVASGEISGNAHGVLGLSVDTEKDFAEILSGAPDAIKKLFPTPGITFNGAVPTGNTADDLSLFVMTSIDVDEDNVPTPADQKLENAPTVTVAANLGDAVVKTAEWQGVVRYCEDAVVPFSFDGVPPVLAELVSKLSGVKGVDYEPVAEIPFTVGIADGKGSVDNFQSAMEGYLVTAETDGELMFIEGVTELTLTEEDQTLTVNEGNTLQLHAAVKAPEGCSTAVVWTSSDETVATVSASGIVTGVKEGTVTVTVTADGGVSKTCQVKVTPKAADTPTYIGSTSESVKTTVTVNGTDYEVKATVTDGVLTPNSADMAKLLANLNSIISMEIDARGTGATSAVLPEAVAKALLEKMTKDSKGIAFITDECALLLNPAAVANLFADAPGSLTVGIEKIAEKDLNANQIRQVQGLDVAALLRTNVRVGGKAIHELGTDGEALMLTNASESKTVGAVMKAAYLAPSAMSIAETAGRIAAFDVGGFAYINGGRLAFNSEVRSNTCSEYVLYYEAAETDADADAVASCGHGDDCPLAAFTDVDPNAWYHDGVHYVLLKGWMQGLGDGIFDPGGTTTRAMAAQLLWNMEGKPAATAAVPFADVAADAWYASAVAWAAENGVVEGWTDAATGKQVFAPDEFVTREQFAAMLYRYAKLHGLGFTGLWSFRLEFPDAADVSDWALEAMSWMVMQGIINGIDGKLVPQGSSTRAQIATMVYRYDAIKAE